MARRPIRKTNRTVLIVVEGETEVALLNHLKDIYYQRGMQLSVSIKNAQGHGPQGIIDKLKSVAKTADFDHRIAVLDADIPVTTAEAQWFRKQSIQTIVSTPAIEATLLAVLGKPTQNDTVSCKRFLQLNAPGDPTEIRYYQKYFPHDLLQQKRRNTAVLDALIKAVSTSPF